MAMRYRNSIKLGNGIKLNLNKNSMSVTVGVKGFRYTKNTNGRSTTSVNLPVKGLSYTNISSKRRNSNSRSVSSSGSHNNTFTTNTLVAESVSTKSKKISLLSCILGGWIGIHNFYVGRIGKGILYLFTMGLFCIGWLYDIFAICSGKFLDSHGSYVREN